MKFLLRFREFWLKYLTYLNNWSVICRSNSKMCYPLPKWPKITKLFILFKNKCQLIDRETMEILISWLWNINTGQIRIEALTTLEFFFCFIFVPLRFSLDIIGDKISMQIEQSINVLDLHFKAREIKERTCKCSQNFDVNPTCVLPKFSASATTNQTVITCYWALATTSKEPGKVWNFQRMLQCIVNFLQ